MIKTTFVSFIKITKLKKAIIKIDTIYCIEFYLDAYDSLQALIGLSRGEMFTEFFLPKALDIAEFSEDKRPPRFFEEFLCYLLLVFCLFEDEICLCLEEFEDSRDLRA